MPSFAKLLHGITQKSADSSARDASVNPACPSDSYHTAKCNRTDPKANIKVSLVIESPPLLIFGTPAESSGAMFNGSLLLDIFPRTQQDTRELLELQRSDDLSPISSMASLSQLSQTQLKLDYVEMRQVTLYLIQVIHYSKPFLPSSRTLQACPNCRRKITELTHWDVLSGRKAFAKGTRHSYPFSYLIPGKTPPTTILSNSGMSITYELVCKTRYVNARGVEDMINLSLPIMIRRSIMRGHDRNSLRVFPPTEVTATAAVPNVAYPRSTFPVEIRMDNIASKERRWRMRKLNWRIEESVRVRANCCSQHQAKYGVCVDFTKHRQGGRKVNKNSGGVGNPTYNYFFENPEGADSAAIAPVASESSQSSAAAEGSTEGSALSDLSPFSSNWSGGVQPRRSGNLDSAMSSHIQSPLPTSTSAQQSEALSNPDEVVMPMGRCLCVEEIRTLSSGEMKSGWKSDFSDKGRIEFVVDVSVMGLSSMGFNSAGTNITTITSENCESPLFDPSTYLENGATCSCDIQDHDKGIYVSHNLILEAVVAEEVVQTSIYAPSPSTSAVSSASRVMGALVPEETLPQQRREHERIRRARETAARSRSRSDSRHSDSSPEQTAEGSSNVRHDGGIGPDPLGGNKEDAANHISGIPTGVARVLRMQFKVVLTERSGLGVSWDDEVPPTYHAVGDLSPPSYIDATSGPSTPLLSSLVIPLDESGRPDVGEDRDRVVLAEPSLPQQARLRSDDSIEATLETRVSNLQL